jgi:sugar phosphate isomerase/epimerase
VETVETQIAAPGLSLCTWGMGSLSREEAAAVALALDFDGVDVGSIGFVGAAKKRFVEAPLEIAAELRDLPLPVANFFYFFGGDVRVDRNLADPASHPDNEADLVEVLRLCEAAAIPSLTLSPGIFNPGQSSAEALAASAEFLRRAVGLGAGRGIALMVEPGVQTIAETPAAVAGLLEMVPGLGLVLDYSHFVCLGHRQEEIDILLPRADHIHLRQARPGRLQERLASFSGTINFALLFARLRECGYAGWCATELGEHLEARVDVLAETVALRDMFRTHMSDLEETETGG